MDQNINSIGAYEDSRGDLWLADMACVTGCGMDGEMLYTEQDGLPPAQSFGHNAKIMMAAVWFSLARCSKMAQESFVLRTSDLRLWKRCWVAHYQLNQLIKDREGSLWIATTSGLYRLRKYLIAHTRLRMA